MSEYTNYFATKSVSQVELISKLEESEISSIVEDLEKENNWQIFYCPSSSQDFPVWEKIGEKFQKVIELFVEEDRKRWLIKTSLNGELREFKFYSDEKLNFTDDEKKYLSDLFEMEYSQLEEVLAYGKAYEFTKVIGLPYLDIMDQNIFPNHLFANKKVVLASTLD